MVRTTKNKATWFAALAMAMVLVFGQIPSAAIAEVMGSMADASAQTEVVTTTEGEPEQGVGSDNGTSADGEKDNATAPEEPSAMDEAATDDAVNAGEKNGAAEGTADDEATDDEQATAEEAPEVAGPVAYGDSPAATDESGVKVKLFDYVDDLNTKGPAAESKKKNVNLATPLQDLSEWPEHEYNKKYAGFQFNGSGAYTKNDPWNSNHDYVSQGIVQNTLGSNGYPAFSNMVTSVMANGSQKDMKYLFTESDYAKEFGVTNPEEFLSKNGNNYSFDSSKKFAQYDTKSGIITLKDPVDTSAASGAKPTFLPFNDSDKKIDRSNVNYAFGMTVEANFRQPKDGKVTVKNADGTESKSDMVFDFTGDDDVWLYIDGVLVLDIGGVHPARSGSINFATGVVYVDGQKATTLRALMRAALGDKWVEENMKGNTFKDFSNHTMKFFYLERGHGGSNCKLDFNLETVPKGVIEVHKQITDSNTADFSNAEFKVRVDVAHSADPVESGEDLEYSPYVGKYEVWKNGVKLNDGETTADNPTFWLKNGEYVRLLDNIKATDWYKVTELAGDKYDSSDYEFSANDASVVSPDAG